MRRNVKTPSQGPAYNPSRNIPTSSEVALS